jgi:hypothetical protein
MKFIANDYLEHSIEKFMRTQKWIVPFVMAFIIILSFASYYRTPEKQYYVTGIVIYVALFILLIYQGIIVTGKQMNRVIKSVSINEHIIAETYPFRFLIFKLDAKIRKIDKTNSSMSEVDFPYKRLKLKDYKALAISYGDEELYLLYDYFPTELKEHLIEISSSPQGLRNSTLN